MIAGQLTTEAQGVWVPTPNALVLQYTFKIISAYSRNRSEKVFTKGGIGELAVKSSQPRCYLHNL